MINWRVWRFYLISVTILNAVFLVGLSDALGFSLATEVLSGVKIQILLGILNIVSAIVIWKQL